MTDFRAEAERLRREDGNSNAGAYRRGELTPPNTPPPEPEWRRSPHDVDADGLSAAGRAVHRRQDRLARFAGALSVLLGVGVLALAFTIQRRALLSAGVGVLLVGRGLVRIARGREPR